jgi:hypothetical protein
MKKMMLVGIVMLSAASMSWANLIWNFDDGTAQSWVNQNGNAAGVDSNRIWTQVQNGGGGTAILEISGLNETIGNTSAYVEMDLSLNNNPAFPYAALRVEVVTNSGTYEGYFGDNSPNSVSYTDRQFNLFTDLAAAGESPALMVGDVVTGVRMAAFGFSYAIMADNIDLVVPEPATIGLIALGGLVGLRRRSRA